MAKTTKLCKMHSFPLQLIHVNALPCKTQMLQIVTSHGDYSYQISHNCITNSTKGVKRFNNFFGIKYFTVKITDNKIAD